MAILMTEEPFGRNDCSKEMKLERVISATPSVLKSRPIETSPEAAMMREDMLRTTGLPPPVPTENPPLPKLDLLSAKLMTGTGGPVGVEPPVPVTLAPLTATVRLPAFSSTPGTPTRLMPAALAVSA